MPATVKANSSVVPSASALPAAASAVSPVGAASTQTGARPPGTGAGQPRQRGGRGLWLAGAAVLLLLCMALGATSVVTGALALPLLMETSNPGRPAGTPTVLFQDDFSTPAGQWTVADGPKGSAGYDQGDYVIRVLSANWAVWSTAAAGGVFGNFHVEVTAGSTGKATDEGFGLICGYIDEGHYDVLAMTGNGYYEILRRAGGSTTVLTDDQGAWRRSVRITPGGQAYRLGADCGADGRLVLYVDGQQVAAASDPAIQTGLIGFFVQTFYQAPAEVRFKDLIVTQLP
jgi:hypothetical protein